MARMHRWIAAAAVVVIASEASAQAGLGDVMLNWRVQAVGSEGSATWISPRVSLVLPSTTAVAAPASTWASRSRAR